MCEKGESDRKCERENRRCAKEWWVLGWALHHHMGNNVVMHVDKTNEKLAFCLNFGLTASLKKKKTLNKKTDKNDGTLNLILCGTTF